MTDLAGSRPLSDGHSPGLERWRQGVLPQLDICQVPLLEDDLLICVAGLFPVPQSPFWKLSWVSSKPSENDASSFPTEANFNDWGGGEGIPLRLQVLAPQRGPRGSGQPRGRQTEATTGCPAPKTALPPKTLGFWATLQTPGAAHHESLSLLPGGSMLLNSSPSPVTSEVIEKPKNYGESSTWVWGSWASIPFHVLICLGEAEPYKGRSGDCPHLSPVAAEVVLMPQ